MSHLRARCFWRNTQTGEEGVYTEEPSEHGSVWADEETPARADWFMWSEGNYSCDCNREIFFTGKPRQEGQRGDDFSCGGGKWLIKRIEALDASGNIVDFLDPYEEEAAR